MYTLELAVVNPHLPNFVSICTRFEEMKRGRKT